MMSIVDKYSPNEYEKLKGRWLVSAKKIGIHMRFLPYDVTQSPKFDIPVKCSVVAKTKSMPISTS
jgi:hypothetical protein